MKRAIWILLAASLLIYSCSGFCEVVMNSNGPGFLKIVNDLDSSANYFFPDYAYGGEIDPGACEIYGMALGDREADITVGLDAQNFQFTIEDGETYTIELSQYF